jgi:hypothetical protein
MPPSFLNFYLIASSAVKPSCRNGALLRHALLRTGLETFPSSALSTKPMFFLPQRDSKNRVHFQAYGLAFTFEHFEPDS